MKAIFCCAFLLLITASGASADTALGVKDLIELAIQRNPELKALSFEEAASDHSADQASRWNNPNFGIGGERKEEPAGDTNFTKFELSQTIDMPGKLSARVKGAKARAATSKVNRTYSEIEMRFAVLKLIYEYKVASEKAEHAKERFDRFKTVNTYLRSRVFASPQKHAEAAIVRAKLLILGRELRKLEVDQKGAWGRLNLYLGLKSEPEIRVKWYKTAPAIDLQSLSRLAEEKNPELQKQMLKMEEIKSELTLAKYEAWPGFTLTGSFSNGSGTSPEKIYGLGLSIPLPVFNANRSGIHAQENKLAAEEQRRSWTLESAKQSMAAAIEHYKASLASVMELKIDEIPKLEKDMNAVDAGFRKGQVDLLTYIEADGEHFDSLNAIFDSQVDFIEAQAALYLLAGQAPAVME